MDPQQQRSPTYPSYQPSLPPITSLTSELPPPEPSPGLLRHAHDMRDSGTWSISQSKHSSYGSTGLQLHSILNSAESPSRNSVGDGPHSARGSLQPSLPPVAQSVDSRQSFQSNQSLDANSLQESRRSSVDSRMNAGMNHLAISPTSPYEAQNQSRTSLATTLQQQRGISSDIRHNGSAPLSPLGSRMGPRATVPPRRAPVINANIRSVSGMPDPTAAAPTKGFPWAFPDRPPEHEEPRGSSSGDSGSDRVPSRANSFATSINSSVYTAGDGMPAGQRRFDEDAIQTHHHSIQHRSVSSLQASEQGMGSGGGNYSRTPELRVSHKMAERKRRSEMKSLFDELNAILPNSPGGKSSKWEVLARAIDYIKSLKYQNDCNRRDVDRLRNEMEALRKCDEENRSLRIELHAMWQHMHRIEPNKSHVFGHITTELERGQASNMQGVQSGILPPIQQQQQQVPGQWPSQPSGPMQGVEFAPTPPFESRP